MDLNHIQLFLFDMDGTLCVGNTPFDFSVPLLDALKQKGKRYLFMTNNSSKNVSAYVEKFRNMGIAAEYGDFVTSSQATALYLKEHYPTASLYVCGTQSLKDELAQNGFTVTTDTEKADCIVVGFDTELTFQKLADVSRMLCTRDIPYIATHPDYICPMEFGAVPDCGSICDILFAATGKKPFFIGKPTPAMPQMAMKMMGCTPDQTAVVGDRIYTDIKSGLNAGCKTILVMSGETTYEMLEKSPDKPDIVLNNASEILNGLD